MKRRFANVLLSVILGLVLTPLKIAHAWGITQTSDQLPVAVVDKCEWSLVYAWTWHECEITLFNSSSESWAVTGVASEENLSVVGKTPIRLLPHSTVKVATKLNAGGTLGRNSLVNWLMIQNTKGSTLRVGFAIRTFVYSGLDAQPILDLGVIDSVDRVRRAVSIQNADDPDFRLIHVIRTPDFIDAVIAPDGKGVLVSLAPSANWGINEGVIRVATNSEDEPEIRVLVKGDVHGRIVPSKNPLALGLLRTNNANDVLVRLNSKDGKDFKVGKIDLDRIVGTTEILPCEPMSDDCKLVRFRLGKDQPTGNLGSQLHIDLPQDGKTLVVGMWGLLLKPDAEVRDFNSEYTQASASRASTGSASVDFKKAIARAARKAAPPPAPLSGTGPLLQWTTENESGVYGYLIYRASEENGPFAKVNEEVIRASGRDDFPQSYAWRDSRATSGNTYWYYISTLYTNGTRKLLSSPQKVIAK